MNEVVDGEFQKYCVESGAYIRKHFFGKYPELLELVEDLSDDELRRLTRGGHDPVKVYAAYKAAVEHTGSPTVILAHTIKGYGLGEVGEAQEHDAPAEEDDGGRTQALPQPLPPADPRRDDRHHPVLQAGRRQPGVEVPPRAPAGAGRLAAGPARSGRSRS